MFYRRIVTAAAGIALVLSAPGASAADDTTADDVTVTLITGDQVILPDGDTDDVWVRHGEGRDHISFRIDQHGDQLRVTPSDAVGLLAGGRVDPRLFDVTRLIDYGYQDAARDTVPVIVRPSRSVAESLLGGLLRAAGALVTGTLRVLGMATAQVPKDETADMWSRVKTGSIERLWLDGIRRPMLDDSVPQVHADQAHRIGLDGSGVTVAVIDTGIDTSHPDLAGQIVKSKNFTNERGDKLGHGTHVASIIAGTGAASDGRYSGVAPGARLLNAKVCTEDACPESGILKAMEWATVDRHARIVNFSLGESDTPGIDPLEEAVNRLTAKTGALFVTAAGNGGDEGDPVITPASADAALAVGAVDEFGDRAPFSATGPRVGDGALKPDITAPGVGITAARARGSDYGVAVNRYYQRISGTSMATPHVTGAAAILAQQHPRWDADELKAALMQSARPNPGLSPYEQGSGLLDVAAATEVGVVAEPTGLTLRGDAGQVTRKLTYRNLTTETAIVRLSVAVPAAGRAGTPRVIVRLTDRLLVVPPHGSAETVVTAYTAGLAGSPYWGWIKAYSDGRTSVTPFAVVAGGN